MKLRFALMLLVGLLLVTGLTGCGEKEQPQAVSAELTPDEATSPVGSIENLVLSDLVQKR